MFVKVGVDWLECVTPTDNTIFNNRDEAYFLLTGGTVLGPIPASGARISPPPPEDYYGLKKGESRRDIALWEGFIPNNSYSAFGVVLREQDNAQLAAFTTLAAAAGGQILGLV